MTQQNSQEAPDVMAAIYEARRVMNARTEPYAIRFQVRSSEAFVDRLKAAGVEFRDRATAGPNTMFGVPVIEDPDVAADEITCLMSDGTVKTIRLDA